MTAMTGSGTETLTAALRRLADEHASGLLAVATQGRDVVLELADGVPVGIGPTRGVSTRVDRDASPALLAAAVVDELVDRTVATIIGGGGSWTWDVSSDADMMPLPQGLAAELSRRAVDAAQALATLEPDLVLQPGRDLETTGEVARVRSLFDGQRSIAAVAEEAGITLAACATFAAAMVRAGVLSTGMEDTAPTSWTDTVAGAADDEDEDEPELWVMDEPEDLDEFDEADETDEEDVGGADEFDEADETGSPPEHEEVTAPPPAATDEITEAMEWVSGEDTPAESSTAPESPTPAESPTASESPAAAAAGPGDDDLDDGWDDTGWMDELDTGDQVPPVVEARSSDEPGADRPGDARSALSSMLSDLQGSSEVEVRDQPPPARTTEADEQDEEGDDDRPGDRASKATRKEPKAQPGEVAEFLRELSRLALDDD